MSSQDLCPASLSTPFAVRSQQRRAWITVPASRCALTLIQQCKKKPDTAQLKYYFFNLLAPELFF